MSYETANWIISEEKNIQNNSSYIVVAFGFRKTDGNYWGKNQTGTARWRIGVDNNLSEWIYFNFNWNIPKNEWKEIGRRGFTVYHNSDGTKTVNLKGEIDFGSGVLPGKLVGNSVAILKSIPRKSFFKKITGNTIGEKVIIEIGAYSNLFTHKLWYKFGNTDWIEISTEFILPMDLCYQIPTLNEGILELCLRTYSDGVDIGEIYYNHTVYVPDNVHPTINTVECTEASEDMIGKNLGYVQHKSRLRIITNYTASYASMVMRTEVRVQGNETWYGNKITTDFLNSFGKLLIKVTIFDSRGRSDTKEIYIDVAEYHNIKLGKFNAYRSNNGMEDENGSSLKVDLNYEISPINNKNQNEYNIQILKNGTNNWITIQHGFQYKAQTISYEIKNIVDVDFSYKVRLILIDSFESITANVDIGTGSALIDFNKSGKGISFGKVSSKDALEVNMPTEFLKEVKVINDEVYDVGYVVEEGVVPQMSYKAFKFSNGMMLLTCKIKFTLNVLEENKWGNLYYQMISLGKYPISFIETPHLLSIRNIDTDNGFWFSEVFNRDHINIGYTSVIRPTPIYVPEVYCQVTSLGRWKND